uniref:C2 domain-containing protein n=1 Tax=Glycine max TaxID=3847 RepID=A0A0R0I2C9_SOYBN
MAVFAVYYRFSWQMEGGDVPCGASQSATEFPGVSSWLVCFRESNLSKVVKKTKVALPTTSTTTILSGINHLNLMRMMCKCKFGRTGDGSIKVEWIPLEGVSSGELKLKIEAIKVEDQEGSRGSTNGWIELVVIEARDLIVADLRGTSDPYVRPYFIKNCKVFG